MTTTSSDRSMQGTASDSDTNVLESAGAKASLLYYLHACPVCSSPATRHYCRSASLYSPGEFLVYEECLSCRTVFRNPRLPDAERLLGYEEMDMDEELTAHDPRNQIHYSYVLKIIEKELPTQSERKFLDFGCGSGGFLVAARDRGFDVMGLELSKGLASFVTEEYGIPVFQGLVTDPAFAEQRFDVIVSAQVFEHLLDPRQTLGELSGHLRRPGLLLIEVPNLHDIRERLRRGALMDDSHLFYFSAGSLSQMLRNAGFRILKVQEGLRPFRFRPLRSLPDGLLFAGERLLSALQIKTGLSVLARLD